MSRQRLTRRRMQLGLAVLVLLFTVFGIRLFQIQGLDTSTYAAMARETGTASTVIPAPRGRILDRDGKPLAGTVDGLTITADPSMTADDAPRIAQILTEVLGPDVVDYFATIDLLRTPRSRFVYLVRDLPAWEAEKAVTAVRDAGHDGVFSEQETLRTYPGGTLAANLIGYVDGNGTGVQGLEAEFDDELTGTDGSATYEVSPTGQRIPLADSVVVEMEPGSDLVTTIDRDLQWYADQRLSDAVRSAEADWGLAITMDVETGQLVQMSQVPTFNPDSRTSMSDDRTVNRALQTVYEPGSVLKVITMAALADRDEIAPDTRITVPGSMVIDGFPIGDYWPHGTLNLTAAGVIAKSSNLGTIIAAEQMSNPVMHDYLSRFGFGSTSGIGLPGESAGILTPAEKWTRANHATISFGQGISTTAIQVVRAIGAIAGDGEMVDPTVVSEFVTAGERVAAPAPERRRVVSAEASAAVRRMMEAVTAPDGTAPDAAIPGYRVAGKTGTAWRVDPETGRYVRGQNTVSFVGIAPADQPRFVTYVVLDRPHSEAGGGSTAAPVFHDIMSMALERFGVTPTGSKRPTIPQTW